MLSNRGKHRGTNHLIASPRVSFADGAAAKSQNAAAVSALDRTSGEMGPREGKAIQAELTQVSVKLGFDIEATHPRGGGESNLASRERLPFENLTPRASAMAAYAGSASTAVDARRGGAGPAAALRAAASPHTQYAEEL
jgi:hypothetical protein